MLACLFAGEAQSFNRSAHVELFKKSVQYLSDCGLTDAFDFYTGSNPAGIDIRWLADNEDEIMWVDVHSTTEPDEMASEYLIRESHAYCWNDSLERLTDPQDIESCKDCIRSVVSQFPEIALPRPGQETVFFPSRGTTRSRYDFSWEIPLSFIVGLADSFCDSLGTRYGVRAENSLRTKVHVHSSKFKSMEYLNYAIRDWNDSDCESSLRWLARICNYDPDHTQTAFKSYDYLTEDWVSQDMDGDHDIDYYDSQVWNQNLLSYGMYYVLFSDLADTRIPTVASDSIPVHMQDIMDSHSDLMNQRATYSATLWPLVNDMNDYFNGNALKAVDTLLPRIVKATAGLLADFYYNVADSTHPEFVLIDVEGIPRSAKVPVHYSQARGNAACQGVDSLSGEHFKYYKIPVSFSLDVEPYVGCDSVLGYRFDHMAVCDGETTYERAERSITVQRATTIHLVYSRDWNRTDAVEDGLKQMKNQQFAGLGCGPPRAFFLSQNRPNPAANSTTILYALPASSRVKLEIYGVNGRMAASIADRDEQAGHHSARMDISGLANGFYFCRLEAGQYVGVSKMIVLK